MNFDALLHLDRGDASMLKLVLRNARNYLDALPEKVFQLHIVANGGSAPLFTNEHADLRDASLPLMERGVRFKVCANSLAEHGIDPAAVWPGCEIVPAGLVEIVRLQREGFAYIKP